MVEQEFGMQETPLQELRLIERGRDVAVVIPGSHSPLDPFSGQWFLPFSGNAEPNKIHSMSARSAEELFECAIEFESRNGMLELAVENYRRVIELEPEWVEAHINLGVALYQMGRTDEARTAFRTAVEIDPANGISRYNLGCVLEEKGEINEAIEHLRAAARMMPSHADVHFNLALAYDKRGERQLAQEQWTLYLRYAPNGPWADQARARLNQYSSKRKRSAPIPFPRKAQS
jgi:tetratricopeptide (TPR) repeat protein